MSEKEKSQTELLKRKITMSEIKHAVDGVNKRLDATKEEFSKSEDIVIEVTQNKQKVF